MRAPLGLATLGALVVFTAGCGGGGRIDGAQLQKQLEAVQSTAPKAPFWRVMSLAVARDRRSRRHEGGSSGRLTASWRST